MSFFMNTTETGFLPVLMTISLMASNLSEDEQMLYILGFFKLRRS